jgi:hypothetical protein
VLDRLFLLALYLAIEDAIVAAVAAEIRACAFCRPRAYYVCAQHRRLLAQLPPCPDPDCPGCNATT